MQSNNVSPMRAQPRLRRTLATLAFAVIAIVASVTVAAEPASASSSGCTGTLGAERCIHVTGSGLHVDSVWGTFNIANGYGGDYYVEIWGSGFYYTCCGASYGGGNHFSSPTYTINRNLPNGSAVCATLHYYNGAQLSPACVTIHS